MTQKASNQEWELNRRTVLKSAAVIGAVGTFGLPAFSGSVAASSHTTETLYLTDSGGDNAGNFLGKLYSVDLDDSFSPPRANLTLLKDFTDTDFGRTAAIAASPDGTTVYMVDANSRHLGTYDVSSGTFTDKGVVAGIPSGDTGVVLAATSPAGTLYVASQADNKLYTVDPSGPTATEFVTVSGADVQGADIVFDAAGTLYLYSSSQENLYTVDYDSSSPTFGDATLVGKTGDFYTGLAVRAAGTGDLVGSNTTRDEIVVIDKGTGAAGAAYEMYLDGSRYAYGYGDMTVGQLADPCMECDIEGLVAKFEFEEDEETESYTFLLEEGSDEYVSFESFTSKEGEVNEPMTATFGTEYCELYAVVKSGQEIEVQSFEDIDGGVTVETANDEKYAISFVSFYCTEQAAQDAADAFPSKGKGN
jgi:sugar lactone lactonase YvrE